MKNNKPKNKHRPKADVEYWDDDPLLLNLTVYEPADEATPFRHIKPSR